MRERVKFAMVAAMLMILAGLSWLLPLRLIAEGDPVPVTGLALLLSAAITFVSALYIRQEHCNAREGFPLMDERSTALRAMTGNYAFFVSAAAVLGLFALEVAGVAVPDNAGMQAGEVLFAVLLLMVCIYLGIWMVLTFKWRVD
jgi:drug/metabolite transporter (DMT)-like permease